VAILGYKLKSGVFLSLTLNISLHNLPINVKVYLETSHTSKLENHVSLIVLPNIAKL
jgi:hypothetical protein